MKFKGNLKENKFKENSNEIQMKFKGKIKKNQKWKEQNANKINSSTIEKIWLSIITNKVVKPTYKTPI